MTSTLQQPRLSTHRHWLGWLSQLGPVVGLIVIIVYFSIRSENFPTANNARNILQQTAMVGTAAIGATLVIIAAGIDLSVGSIVAMTSVVAALILHAGHSPMAAVGGAVLAGALAGCINGLLITKLNLLPFIVTLGTLESYRGLTQRLGNNASVAVDTTWLNELVYPPTHSWMLFAPAVWIMLLFIIAMAIVLRLTQWGRHVYAVGSNEQTARLCGVNVVRTKILVYTVAGFFAGLAGIIAFAKTGEGDVTTAEGLELNVIAAVVLGGASLNGGQGSVFGTLVGALIMTVIANGCSKLGMPNSDQKMLTGAIIILAAGIDRFQHRKSGK